SCTSSTATVLPIIYSGLRRYYRGDFVKTPCTILPEAALGPAPLSALGKTILNLKPEERSHGCSRRRCFRIGQTARNHYSCARRPQCGRGSDRNQGYRRLPYR